MFGNSAGDYYYGDCVNITDPDKSEGEGYLQEQSVILDTRGHKLYVKVGNASANSKMAKVDISRFKPKGKAKKTVLSGNPEDENNFEAQPIAPQTETLKATGKFDLPIPPYSFTMIEYDL